MKYVYVLLATFLTQPLASNHHVVELIKLELILSNSPLIIQSKITELSI